MRLYDSAFGYMVTTTRHQLFRASGDFRGAELLGTIQVKRRHPFFQCSANHADRRRHTRGAMMSADLKREAPSFKPNARE